MRLKTFLAFCMLACLSVLAAHAQGNDQTILYGVKKNQMPQGVVVEQGQAAPGIPADGTQQADRLRRNNPATARPQPYGNAYGQPYAQPYGQPYAPGYNRGPNVIYRDPKDKGLTVITGPDGTTVCRDASGRVTVCY